MFGSLYRLIFLLMLIIIKKFLLGRIDNDIYKMEINLIFRVLYEISFFF